MTTEKKLGRPQRDWASRLPVILTLIATLAALGGACLHAMGAISHRTYLVKMGVAPDLFPKPVDWIIINGYEVLAGRWLLLFKLMFDHPFKFVASALCLILLGVFLWEVFRWQPKETKNTLRIPSWAETPIRIVMVSFMVLGTLPLAIYSVMLVLLLIGAPGEFAGKDAAAKDLARFAFGCTPSNPCADISKNDTHIISGFVIDSSTSHIAIYDPAAKRTRVLELEGLQISSPFPIMKAKR